MRLLVVENEETVAVPLINGLRRHGYDVVGVDTGNQALEIYEDVDLVLLDLELPDMDGLEVCRTVTEANTPVIAFTERGTESDRVLGLQAGSDDCLDKPYGFRELMARIDAVMRRVERQNSLAEPLITRGQLRINNANRQVWLGSERIEVTPKEFELLFLLASRPGVVHSRHQLMSEVWGDSMNHKASTRPSRTIDTHVSSLRSKLGSGHWIHTVRGFGFCFTAE
ncbi:DNA-binding response regulator, OmpR family, contains REC and winged-helix (wHTH) domain [Actinopolyspora alba]|uniref:DNA-binding response regulator, OmpR family, contains REC and winged-helix (WHTH) domain n=1 Tax=Actinopolyspora alba TaxID=673379 RepID=A0A1I1VP79_9ACTN|nr:response regulator transcription factor [Actinopolyspora alba]SFD84827.1 DNA-binding response regulator, OmpR family, contains REC and winged-helix (wHTH) domain [Actinopolyspora alba]